MLSSFVRVAAFAMFLASVSPANAQVGESADDDARTLFLLGQEAFNAGRYQAALDNFQQAYDLSHRAQLLYNIGQAADRLRDDRRALAAFERFLVDVPESPQHASTRARADVLRVNIAEEEARAAADALARAAAVPAPAEESSGPSATVGWIVGGVGVAALATGATFLVLGLRDNASVEDAPTGSPYADVHDAYERGPTRITVGAVLLGVGAAATATGLVLALRAGSGDDEAPTALSLDLLPGGLRLRGSF